jgi:hypothetical protein
VVNKKTTKSDAIAQINLARVGSLTTESGRELTAENLEYLYELRNRVYAWSDAIHAEIGRIEKQANGRKK